MLEKLKEVIDCNPDSSALRITLAELKSMKNKDDNKIRLLTQETIGFVSEIVEEYHSCVSISRHIEEFIQAQKEANSKLEELQKKYAHHKKEEKRQEEKKKRELLHYNLFANNLGLYLYSVTKCQNKEPHCMNFSFTNIDKKNPDKIFSFHLSTDGVTYNVWNCTPKIIELEALLKDLNETNDLQAFVIKVRRHFCEIAASTR